MRWVIPLLSVFLLISQHLFLLDALSQTFFFAVCRIHILKCRLQTREINFIYYFTTVLMDLLLLYNYCINLSAVILYKELVCIVVEGDIESVSPIFCCR